MRKECFLKFQNGLHKKFVTTGLAVAFVFGAFSGYIRAVENHHPRLGVSLYDETMVNQDERYQVFQGVVQDQVVDREPCCELNDDDVGRLCVCGMCLVATVIIVIMGYKYIAF